MVNSRSSLVTATPANPHRSRCVQPGHPFSRSYGASLPSSLTRVISHALVSSTCPPVSVCGTVRCRLARGFSWPVLAPVRRGFLLSSSCPRDPTDGFACRSPLDRNTAYQPRAWRCSWRHPFAMAPRQASLSETTLSSAPGAGLITCCPSPTPFGLGLGPAKLKRTILP